MSKTGYSSPMSFIGGTRRGIHWAQRQSNTGAKVVAWAGIVLYLPLLWLFLAGWYVVVFGLFGLLTIPFRFFRRSQRKSLAMQQEQLELMREAAEKQSEGRSG
jgi:hypothetical protein